MPKVDRTSNRYIAAMYITSFPACQIRFPRITALALALGFLK